MAPTEILANQHFESFISYFRHLPINIGLITSSGCKKFPSKSSQKFGDAAQSEALLARRSLGEAGAVVQAIDPPSREAGEAQAVELMKF